MIQQFTQLSSFASQYDALFVDLWGVIHDGQEMYPEVTNTLQQLKKEDIPVIFLSNAPRRAIRAVEGLERFGIDASLYHSVITSGEMAYDYITHGDHPFKPRYYIIGPARDDGLLLENPDFTPVKSIDDADFLIVTGFDNDASTLDEKMPEIEAGLARNLPLICANPDLEIVRITGVRALCAGVIAKYYEAQGGDAHYFGKPYPDVYQRALSTLNITDKSRVAAIGDNLHTDILGANCQDIDSYLVPSGILSEPLGITHGELPETEKLDALCKQEQITPTATLAAFIW